MSAGEGRNPNSWCPARSAHHGRGSNVETVVDHRDYGVGQPVIVFALGSVGAFVGHGWLRARSTGWGQAGGGELADLVRPASRKDFSAKYQNACTLASVIALHSTAKAR
jgi:hypothetical protein